MDDDDTPLPSDPITVTINVRNVSAGDTPVDNSAPRFNDGPSTTREVAENTEKDENIGAPVAATDPGDTLTYALDETARDDFDLFDIDSTTGQLKTKPGTVLHFEAVQGITLKTSYEVTVTVTDGKDAENNVVTAANALKDTITVTITVTDVNEAPSLPEGETATRSVSEAAATGTNINSTVDGDDTPVAATDEDRPMQSLTYTLSGTDATSFAIVPTTGQLQTRAALDYETKTDYEVTVTANDGTLSSDPITVTITVIDDVTDGDTAVVNSVPFFNEGPRTTREVNENAAER